MRRRAEAGRGGRRRAEVGEASAEEGASGAVRRRASKGTERAENGVSNRKRTGGGLGQHMRAIA
jgi:hypothetical protein